MDTIHHIAIQVTDFKKTLQWYKDNFNVEITYEDDTWAMVQFDNISLALVIPSQHPAHFAITTSKADIYGTPKKHRDGTESVYIEDPSGNVIEMIKLS